MLLDGKTATVRAVYFDVDRGEHLAVTLDDDPAAELFGTQGRYLYFAPEEVEPLDAASPPGPLDPPPSQPNRSESPGPQEPPEPAR
jgi:hypothetical protein